ncbi:hypothetical protein FB451DRAFT_378623 [Mycena latifolia]|nr:hypothetical protein FB451DRAFT_378623 [Mycena latifolia]
MTSRNFTIDNVNPLIQYAPAAAWTEGSKTDDPLASSYSNGGTFTLCTTQGSSATFSFNGTQVYVFGAKRDNHGPYAVTLDGSSTTLNGFSADPVFSTLFVSDVLQQGIHTVTITNELTDTAKPFLDIDFITWTSTVAGDGEVVTLEDTSTQFSYQPATSWSTDLSSSLLTGFSSNNGHTTLTTGASTTITFAGDFITVFGPVGPTIARYTVKVDGATGATFNATKAAYTPQTPLYHADGLGSGQHTIELISQPAVAGQVFAIDFAQVAPAASTTSTAGNSSGTGGSTSGKTKTSIAPAIGGAIAGVFILILIALLIFFCLRRRKRRREEGADQMALEPKYPAALAPASYTMTSFNSAGVPPSHFSAYSAPNSQIQLVPARYRDPDSPPQGSLSALPPLPVHGMPPDSDRRRTFYTVNNDPSGASHSDGTSSSGRASTVYSSGAAGLGARGQSMSRKGAPLPMPPTANVPLPPDAERMHVPGREQDFGPLPPAYEQATQPYNSRSELAYDRSESGYSGS